ncbi:MAG: right-handed parallel beta-helix repeat-containing protein, partial [Deltaproteobacteria bacterium]|nr:right-handed parallel beta-helix repeat-containing protein [Deltaproteobacteria bacterium]
MTSIKRILYLFAIIVLLAMPLFATDYYVKNGGNDAANGLDDDNAWETIAKVNGESFSGDDIIYFKRGDTWHEKLIPPDSGTSGHQITFGAYGEGADPIINGADVINTWTECAGSWSEIWSAESQSGDSSWDDAGPVGVDRNYRFVIENGSITASATTIRLKFKANSANNTPIEDCAIGEKKAADDGFDYNATPVNIQQDSNDTFTITGGASEYSDSVVFSINSSKDYLVAVNMPDPHYYSNLSHNGGMYYKTTVADETETENVTDYTGLDYLRLVESIESLTAISNVWQATLATEPSAVYFDGVLGDKRVSVVTLTEPLDWYWTGNILYVYSTEDPDGAVDIEACVRDYCVDTGGEDYITVSDIKGKYAKTANFIFNESSNCVVENSHFTESINDGIQIYGDGTGDSDSNIVRYCRINANWRHGVYFNGNTDTTDSNEIYYNLIYANDDNGIQVDNSHSGNVIYNNDIELNCDNGIYFAAVEGFTLKNNLISRNANYELKADDTSTITHTNNCYWRRGSRAAYAPSSSFYEDSIIYNGTGYNATEIVDNFEATAIISNPRSNAEKSLTKFIGSTAGVIASNGDIYANSNHTPNGIHKSTDDGETWTLKRAWPGKPSYMNIDSRDYIYYSPFGADVADADKGLWRSIDGGDNWTRVLDLSAFANSIGIWGMDEDSSGHLYAGLYNNKSDAGHIAKIYKSIDNGGTFSEVYSSVTYDHVHDIAVDLSTDYVYASLGDSSSAVIRSINNGTDWSVILASMNQIVPIIATEGYRLFGSDGGTQGRIYRTTDDSTYKTVLQD